LVVGQLASKLNVKKGEGVGHLHHHFHHHGVFHASPMEITIAISIVTIKKGKEGGGLCKWN
jgi:hypothetical protein